MQDAIPDVLSLIRFETIVGREVIAGRLPSSLTGPVAQWFEQGTHNNDRHF
jgi:hypothetical protein